MKPAAARITLLACAVMLALGAGLYATMPGFRAAIDQAFAILTATDVEAAIAAMVEYLRSFGVWAPLVSAVLMVVQSIAAPIPAFLLAFANGMVFGWQWGAVLTWGSAMLGAAVCFWIARSFGRPAVERLAGGSRMLDAADRFFLQFGTSSVLVARLLPVVSFDLISYAAGLTPMSFGRFLLATGLGQLPATLAYSWLGQSVTGSAQMVFWAFSIVAALFVLGWVLAPRLLRRLKPAPAPPQDHPED